ncbi:MAG: acyl-CoA mutase large subunit family protein, partial [Succiniclasticum sp.]|nr:acyl-CoA mutase large subunit family protein [Succiniclasticum sp.]
MAEETNIEQSKSKPMTDKELEELLRKSEQNASYPDVPFDEFTVPTPEEWVEACNELLKGKPFDKMMYTKNYEGITFDPIYTLRKWKDILPTDDYPGMGDFLRGSTVNGYVHEPWGIAQACDLTEPQENNELLKFEISKGSTVYHVRVDKATLAGVDVKDAEKPGDKGVSLTTVEDMHTMLDGLDLEKIPFMLYTGEASTRLLAMMVAALKAGGKKVEKLKGIVGADPIGELIKNGKTSESLDALYDQMAAAIKWAKKNAPGLRTIFVRSTVFSLGGAESVQEVAYTYAVAVEYVRQMMKRGLDIHDISKAIAFEFNQGANFFMEIAKLRAARQIWANIMKEFGAEEADRASFVHGRPASFTKTVIDPYVNMLRNCTQSFSSVVGGVNTYENEPFDELIRKGDTFSRRIARNIHIMLQEEFGMQAPIDQAGGSWAVEALTKQITEKIWAKFQEVEAAGGVIAALKDGSIQKGIADILAARFKALELRKDRAVGVNMYPNMTEEPLDPRPENTEEIKKILSANVDKYLADVDAKEAEAKLAAVKAAGADALIDAEADAFTAGATIGQVAKAAAKETCCCDVA